MNAVDVAESQVQQFLGRISPARWSRIQDGFPRPLEALTLAAFPKPNISFERMSGLSDLTIGVKLRQKYHYEGFEDCSPEVLMGRIVAFRNYCVIFTNPDFGEATERFTLAHEIGHLELDIRPQLASALQIPMFASEAERALTMPRDPRGMIPSDDGWETPRQIDRREVWANYFAAELLMPRSEVPIRLRAENNADNAIILMTSSFGVSKAAARTRLSTLGLLKTHNHTDPLFGIG